MAFVNLKKINTIKWEVKNDKIEERKKAPALGSPFLFRDCRCLSVSSYTDQLVETGPMVPSAGDWLPVLMR